MAEANEVISPRLGLPDLPVVEWPDDDEDLERGLHWKTVVQRFTPLLADALGRTTTVPAADTANLGGGNVTATYHVTDLADTITQNGRTTDYTLDVTGERIRSWTDNASGALVPAINQRRRRRQPIWISAERGGVRPPTPPGVVLARLLSVAEDADDPLVEWCSA